ncbi:dihydrofolate reductase family protein [Pelobium sp.]|nr:dihydrofolate reductase family protein [Pelobium sp.]MDA9554815.1 dihydrofolate reductase family protein [Pelobium sp.]
MGKIISFMHISLDGFVAGPKGEMNWINVNQEIFDHVGQRIGKSDTALYGKATYEMMEAYWPTAADQPNASKHDIEHSQWYKKAKKVVLSKTMKDANLPNTQIISDHLTENIHQLKQQEDKEILLFGSPRATHSLHQLNLIDGYWLFVNPVILGQGIPLFANIQEKINLKLLSTQQFSCGVVALDYMVDK